MGWFVNVNETHWFVLGLVFLILELATGTTYLLWPAVAAGITGLAVLFVPMPIYAQIGLFAVLTVILTLVGRPLVRNRLFTAGGSSTLNERALSLVGERGVAQAAFTDTQTGEVKIGDTIWRATSTDAIAAGQTVEIVSVDGSMLRVKPA